MIDYFILTQLIIDDLRFPDGSGNTGQLGGGTYAVAGARAFSKNVGFVCCTGPDYAGNYDGWFLKNGIAVAGAPREKNCTHSDIVYDEQGERTETPRAGCGNFAEMMPQVSEIPAAWDTAKGFYFYKDCDETYWSALRGYMAGHSAISCWELDSFYATKEHRDEIAACLSAVDLFSLNLTEGRRITGEDEPGAIIRTLKQMGARNLILRMGANGAVVSDPSASYRIPAVPVTPVDVTGGGNSSTGGFLVGFAESDGDILKAGLAASAAASFIISQYGVPLDMDAIMEEARLRAERIPFEKL